MGRDSAIWSCLANSWFLNYWNERNGKQIKSIFRWFETKQQQKKINNRNELGFISGIHQRIRNYHIGSVWKSIPKTVCLSFIVRRKRTNSVVSNSFSIAAVAEKMDARRIWQREREREIHIRGTFSLRALFHSVSVGRFCRSDQKCQSISQLPHAHTHTQMASHAQRESEKWARYVRISLPKLTPSIRYTCQLQHPHTNTGLCALFGSVHLNRHPNRTRFVRSRCSFFFIRFSLAQVCHSS